MVQDAPHHSAPSSEPMLDAVWHAAAQRLSVAGIVVCIVFGLTGAISLSIADRLWPIVSACVVLIVFGAYAAVVQPALGGVWLQRNTQRLLAAALGTVAAVAGIATGLLVLAAIFGGSIEVMRR
jgi:hypothetical protein